MFYTYAEKQGSGFFGMWEMREVAIDTTRRHLYYSGVVSTLHSKSSRRTTTAGTASTMDSVEAGDVLSSPHNDSSTNAVGSAARIVPPAVESPAPAPSAPTPGSIRHSEDSGPPPQTVTWKKKIKFLRVIPIATEHVFFLDDPHLKETDFYQLEVYGELRSMAKGETPAPGPLLCPSAGLSPTPLHCTLSNTELIGDPLSLTELYIALRHQFETMAVERERAAAAIRLDGDTPPERCEMQTVTSPRPTGMSALQIRRVKLLLRCRDEREFRRLWFVLQSVLGYDKLSVRPYRGLPPYDPRNHLPFAHVPMLMWHTFCKLDKAVFYLFTRVKQVKPNVHGEVTAAEQSCYLCITHDMVMVMRDTGTIPRWVRLQEVDEFHYNITCPEPFVCFLSDPNAPDVLLIPQPPVYGPEAIKTYDPRVDVQRVRGVVHGTCLASNQIRRVIQIKAVDDVSPTAYVERMRREGRDLNFNPGIIYDGALSCPLPKEQLAAVWRQVQGELGSRENVANRAAIPIYESNAHDVDLTREQLNILNQHLEREREGRDDIVGMPLQLAQRLHPHPDWRRESPHGRNDTRRPHSSGEVRASRRESHVLSRVPLSLLRTPQLRAVSSNSPPCSYCSSNCSSRSASKESSYVMPGSRYVTQDEATGGTHEFAHVNAEVHRVVTSGRCTPDRITCRKASPVRERTVSEIVNKSIAALQHSGRRGRFHSEEDRIRP